MTPVLVAQVVMTGFTTAGFFFGVVGLLVAGNAGATPKASGLAVSAALTRQIRRLTTISRFSGIGTIDSGVAASPATSRSARWPGWVCSRASAMTACSANQWIWLSEAPATRLIFGGRGTKSSLGP